MIHIQKTFKLSERRACQAIAQPRSTQRYVGQRAAIDQALSCRMSELCRENPRYGYRRVWALLQREGWEVNKKRVLRLWREADLKVPKKQHKSRRLVDSSENGVSRRRAEYPKTMSGATTSRWMVPKMAAGCEGDAGGRRVHPGVPLAGGAAFDQSLRGQ